MDALRFENVSYRYPGDGRAALDRVELSVEPGQFVLLIGGSGSGKSTLLRAAAGLVPHFHGGRLEGRVTAEGMDTRDHDPRQIARLAGLVFQDPERQLVMRRARREVAFGLENLGHPPGEIAARAEEAMMVTGASRLAERPVERLSGGEQQRVAIASILAMGHRLLLLDEPTSQLDPVAAEELLGLIVRINRDRGVTVVLAEHRTGRLFAEADRVIQLEAGAVVLDDPPAAAAPALARRSPWLLPPVAQAFAAAGRFPLPLSVREARALVPDPGPPPAAPAPALGEPAAAIEHGHKMLGDVAALRDASAGFAAGRVTAMMGENGAGKTTLALALCRLIDLDRGRVRGEGRAGYVSQNPAHYLLHETVADEVAYGLRNLGVKPAEEARRVAEELRRFDLEELAGRHPRDLSSGERQRLAIATVTVMRPALLVLDEPTRGVDGRRKQRVAGLARELAGSGAGVVVVTHDMDFAAEVADEVTTLAAGRVLTDRGHRSLLATSQFFVSQLGLALGVASLAEAGRLLAARDMDPANA
jgi:energy-coupling factor transport system ATP-binding protein